MSLKLFRAAWFLSVLVILTDLLYVYASLPEVIILQGEGVEQISVGREAFFYGMLILIAFINGMVYLVARVFKADDDFRSWFYGQVVTLNIFFVIALSLISLINSHEVFDYSRIGFLIYGSVGLIVAWAIGWPVFKIFKGKASK